MGVRNVGLGGGGFHREKHKGREGSGLGFGAVGFWTEGGGARGCPLISQIFTNDIGWREEGFRGISWGRSLVRLFPIFF